ncbi:hypothetical protein FACS189427_02790 [Planctomycetales bacterium]|nr:hypothetical protein FACS189427_02790 [Planctomycetales bacterium]
MSNVEFTGTDDLARRLLLLEKKVRQSVALEAVQKVNKMLVERVKSVVPVKSGELRDSIAAKSEVYSSGRIAVGIVGPANKKVSETYIARDYATPFKTGRGVKSTGNVHIVEYIDKRGVKRTKKMKYRTYYNSRIKTIKTPAVRYAHLADLGTQQRVTQSGANRGSVAPQQFMERVRLNYLEEAESIFRNAVNEAVNAAGS